MTNFQFMASCPSCNEPHTFTLELQAVPDGPMNQMMHDIMGLKDRYIFGATDTCSKCGLELTISLSVISMEGMCKHS